MSNLEFGTRNGGGSLSRPISCLDRHALFLGPTGGGKSRAKRGAAKQLIMHHTRPCVVVIDPKGDVYDPLRRWAYQRSLDKRMVLINPGEQRRVVGFNPLRPWPVNLGLQAAVATEIFRRALNAPNPDVAPQLDKWLNAAHYGLLHVKATLHEAPELFSYNDATLREAITEKLPHNDVRGDFEWLNGLLRTASNAQAMRIVKDELGSSVNRLRQYTRNDYLRLMLGTREHALDWRQIVNNRSLVLVNAHEGDVLSRQDQRTLCMQVISEVIRETFRRFHGGEARVPVYLFIDEASRFISPELEQLLNEGRGYGCRVVLGLQSLSDLIDPITKDRRLLDSVMTNARLKIVFGGLPYSAAEDMARDLCSHHLDPERRKLELFTPMQLSHTEWVEAHGKTKSRSKSETESEADTEATMRAKVKTRAVADGSTYGSAFLSAHVDSQVISNGGTESQDANGNPTGKTTTNNVINGGSDMHGSSDIDANSHVETTGEAKIKGKAHAHTKGTATTRAETEGEQITRSQMVKPGEPFQQLSSVQFMELSEQLYRVAVEMVRQPRQHATLIDDLDSPIPYRVGDEPDPVISHHHAEKIDLDVMKALPQYYSPPELIDDEIRQRHLELTGNDLPPIDPRWDVR